MNLRDWIRQPVFSSAAQEAILNVMVTNSWITGEMSAAMSPHGVTLVQYNVLRILRGSHPRRLTCSEIGQRMLDRTPDVTRLLDRLERAELVDRVRGEQDRRVVEVAVTRKGLDLLERMDDGIEAAQRRITRHLSEDELRQLSILLDKLRIDQ